MLNRSQLGRLRLSAFGRDPVPPELMLLRYDALHFPSTATRAFLPSSPVIVSAIRSHTATQKVRLFVCSQSTHIKKLKGVKSGDLVRHAI